MESGQMLADPAKASRERGWQPTASFEQVVKKMVVAQMGRLKAVAATSH
jgi:GDPmannose 4,6-dehydratase